MKKAMAFVAGTLLAAGLAVTSCSKAEKEASNGGEGGGSSGGKQVTIKYSLWDSAQLPAYQAVANKFMESHPNIKIEITQLGWDDYWTGLQTEMIGGAASDVFTDHLAKYLDFATKNQLVDLKPYIDRDGVDMSQFKEGIRHTWETQDGKVYGMPKDWDTIAMFYNKNMMEKAGITKDELNELTWNYDDGGTFETALRKLTLDTSGRDAADKAFDKNNVAQYGMVMAGYDDRGQSQFSSFVYSTGWTYTDGKYDSNYHYDDPRFINTIKWIRRMQDEGVFMPFAEARSGSAGAFNAGKAACVVEGAWMQDPFGSNGAFPVGVAPMPIGPKGRKSMMNALSDGIWSGCKNKDEAWEWVKFLRTREAHEIVGSYGVVFPAIDSGTDKALAAFKAKGYEPEPFVEEASTPDGTFMYPLLPNGVAVQQIMVRAFDQILLDANPDIEGILKTANKDVKALF